MEVVTKYASGYNPAMLELARGLRAQTGASIAEGTGIPRRTIYRYLGGAEPTPEHLSALADWLELPVAFFSRPGEYRKGTIYGLPAGFVVWDDDMPDTRSFRERAAAMLDSVPDKDLPELLAYLDELVQYDGKVTRL
jgi:transcriptional regulator with XRE-family HTH domain